METKQWALVVNDSHHNYPRTWAEPHEIECGTGVGIVCHQVYQEHKHRILIDTHATSPPPFLFCHIIPHPREPTPPTPEK